MQASQNRVKAYPCLVSTQSIQFTKGHGTGNDFIIIADDNGALNLSAADVAKMCDRHFGIGADGILRVVKSAAQGIESSETTWFMDYRNSDGSIAEMCGNGLRVFVHFLHSTGRVTEKEVLIATRGGIKKVTKLDSFTYKIEMGKPVIDVSPLEVQVANRKYIASSVHIPNPHAVAFVDDLNEIGELQTSPTANPETAFPDGANFEFIKKVGQNHIAMRVFERGSGETLSCGTGVCAAAVISRLNESQTGDTEWRVDVKGGTLRVMQNEDGEVSLIGPAALVADGEFHLEN
jgi:diaminopimelate epimerase